MPHRLGSMVLLLLLCLFPRGGAFLHAQPLPSEVDLQRLGDAAYVFGPACAEGLAAWSESLRARGYSPDRWGNDMGSGYVAAQRPDFVDAGLQAFLRQFYEARARAAAEASRLETARTQSPDAPNGAPSEPDGRATGKGGDGEKGKVAPTTDGEGEGSLDGDDEGESVDMFGVSSSRPIEEGQGYAGFPIPANNRGRGVHFVPTCWPTSEMIEKWVPRLAGLGMEWTTILNPGSDTQVNRPLVAALRNAGVMPIMRIMESPAAPIASVDLRAVADTYRSEGVHYFEIFNEPNHPVEWSGNMPGLDEAARRTADAWLPRAQAVVAAGGRPAIPSLAPTHEDSPSDRLGHRAFLRIFLDRLVELKVSEDVLKACWISVHNYSADRAAAEAGDPTADGDWILRLGEETRAAVEEKLGVAMPVIGTEGGFQANSSDRGAWQATMSKAYLGLFRYMESSAPDWFLATCPWILANKVAGNEDASWEKAAWFSEDGDWDFVKELGKTSP